MSRIEEEAQRLLQQRRESLWHAPALAPSSPSPVWKDVESLPEPLGEDQRRELAAIDEALTRIAEGRYGACLSCGGPLGMQRIRAIPEARYCMACSGARPATD